MNSAQVVELSSSIRLSNEYLILLLIWVDKKNLIEFSLDFVYYLYILITLILPYYARKKCGKVSHD